MAKVLGNPFATTQVKVNRRRIMQQDLDMYAAIAGRSADACPEQEPVERKFEVATSTRSKAWSAAVLANYLQHLRMPRIASRVVLPEVSEWMRKLSSHALCRIQEAQGRFVSSRSKQAPSDSKSKAA